jgi:proteasome accessory factor A
VGPVVQRLPAQRRPALPRRGQPPRVRHAECDSLTQLVAHDKAGERILEDLLVDAERRLVDEGIGGDIYLFKNNTDSAGNSYGCHENYLVARAGEFSRIADVLLPFLVTRQLICGAGKVLQTPRGAVYCLSQRAEHIWEGVSSATTRSRPIINTRDEPHADAERYRRLHVIVGDSNMSEVTTLLKIGSAHLVLEMIEAGVQFRDFTLDNPIRAIREISHDLTGRRTVRLAGGREASALDIQREYHARAVEHLAARGSEDPATSRVVELWGRTLDAVESQNLSLIDREIDWAIKHRLVERYRERNGLDLASARVAQLDLAYHDIRRGAACSTCCSARGWWSGSPTTGRSRRPRTPRPRPPGPSSGATSSPPPRPPGATSPSTGCTSSSTTRPSAPCCARTRSARSTSGWTG